MTTDYFKILGLSRNARKNAIKRAYYKLAKQYHPDHNIGNLEAEKKFKEVNEAYAALNNLNNSLYGNEKSQQDDVMSTDYYKVLGVSVGASKEDVKNAYNRLYAMYKSDPNLNESEAKRKFTAIYEAYEVLSDDNEQDPDDW